MPKSPDLTDGSSANEFEQAPRDGIKIGVFSVELTDPSIVRGIANSGIPHLDEVYLEGVNRVVFSAVRNWWQGGFQTSALKSTALDFILHCSLDKLPPPAAEMIQKFRDEKSAGVNGATRTYNLDVARTRGEAYYGFPPGDTTDQASFLLTSQYPFGKGKSR